MNFLFNSIFDFVYIAAIILGGITLSLTIIMNAKERDKKHKAMLLFIGAIFVYMTVDFITYYFLDMVSSGGIVFTLITASDTLFCMMTTAWVYLLIVMINAEEKIKMKWITILSAVYLVLSQIFSIALGRYDSYVLYVENGIGKAILQSLNAGYEIFVILVGAICIRLTLKSQKKGRQRNINMVMAVLLIGYMCYTMYWDYSIWLKNQELLFEVYAIDPLILMYAIFSVVMIHYFYINDPLKLKESQVASEDAVRIIAERYGLSGREKEVLMLINCGMSNPQIAGELSISENTVKRHVNNIFRKTETQSRHEIVYKISTVNKV